MKGRSLVKKFTGVLIDDPDIRKVLAACKNGSIFLVGIVEELLCPPVRQYLSVIHYEQFTAETIDLVTVVGNQDDGAVKSESMSESCC